MSIQTYTNVKLVKGELKFWGKVRRLPTMFFAPFILCFKPFYTLPLQLYLNTLKSPQKSLECHISISQTSRAICMFSLGSIEPITCGEKDTILILDSYGINTRLFLSFLSQCFPYRFNSACLFLLIFSCQRTVNMYLLNIQFNHSFHVPLY